MAVKFIGTVSAVAVSIADVLGLDAIAIGALEQMVETCRVSSDAVGFVGAARAVWVSVANEGFLYAAHSSRFYTRE